ncbi:MAG: acyl--CoA ligase [Clostridia bacterium]|nr:acyl--CoA ligase [Clostridia bacterium]
MLTKPGQKICENEATMTFENTVIWAEMFSKNLYNIRCCAICCSSEMATSLALLACFAAGVTGVPLSMRYGQAHCKKILDMIHPEAVIMDVGGELVVYKITDSQYVPPEEQPAVIMCTSGTTGTPKGIMLSEENILSNIKDISDYFTIGTKDSILIPRPLYHCAVLTGEFLTSLINGANIRFYSEQFNPEKMLELIQENQITAFCGTPTLLSMMARFQRGRNIESLKHICISGECMGHQLGTKIYEAFPFSNIYHVYGLTEAAPRVSYLPPKYFREYPDCVGIPLNSVSLKITDKNGKVCSENQEGILWVKGSNVMLGYYGNKEKTKQIIKDGWLCTGDVALINDHGFLKIKGRNDDLIIKAGMNIYPAEIEAALKQNNRVKEVLVYGFTNRFGTQIGLKIAGDFSSLEDVRQVCTELLPSFQIPSIIEIVDEIPKNSSGKIIRRRSA